MEYNMTIIDNEIVPVYETDKGERVVDGRELYTVLLPTGGSNTPS